MTNLEEIERMISEVQKGASVSFASDHIHAISSDRTLVCHFDFEPSTRYSRYIAEFNRILNSYTQFDFKIYSIRSGCIHVTFVAQNFKETEKNLVRRQIMKLMDEHDLKRSFHISKYKIFGKREYSTSAVESA